MSENRKPSERREAAIRAAIETFDGYSEYDKIGLRADRERADEAGRFVANYRWQADRTRPAAD